MGETSFDTIAATTYTGAVVGDVTGDVTGNVSGTITFNKVARTATAAPGGTTGVIADDGGLLQYVTVTSASANNVITLPAPVPGTIIFLAVGANGYELRSSDPATIGIGAGAGAGQESAMAASGLGVIVCCSATSWLGWDINATTLAAIEAAA